MLFFYIFFLFNNKRKILEIKKVNDKNITPSYNYNEMCCRAVLLSALRESFLEQFMSSPARNGPMDVYSSVCKINVD